MTGLDLIVAALAAGASAGITENVTAAVRDAYAALKGLIAARFVRAGGDPAAIEYPEADQQALRARVGAELEASGAVGDEQILSAARSLLDAVRSGNTTVGSVSVVVHTNYGAAGQFSGPVTISNAGRVPPAMPETE